MEGRGGEEKPAAARSGQLGVWAIAISSAAAGVQARYWRRNELLLAGRVQLGAMAAIRYWIGSDWIGEWMSEGVNGWIDGWMSK